MNKKQKKFLAVGSAAVVGVAAAGVYAGTLTPSTSAKAGAGAVDVQASCTSAATLTPGASTWNPTTSKFEYTTMRVTATLTSCTGQEATVNVYKVADGSEISTNASAYTITGGDVTAGYFTVTLDTGVDAGLVATDYKYGLVIQTSQPA